jgi:nucleotide-binding universal stress UspA family protein
VPFPYKKILCPVDFEDNSVQAVAEASALALNGNAVLCLLHVVQINPLAEQGAAEGFAAGSLYEAQEDAARDRVSRLAANIPAGVKYEVVVEIGEPGDNILGAAKKHGADLVVMATHGRSGLRQLVLGSIAQRIVRECGVPVLTVRPPG